jgi:hypothetical protein
MAEIQDLDSLASLHLMAGIFDLVYSLNLRPWFSLTERSIIASLLGAAWECTLRTDRSLGFGCRATSNGGKGACDLSALELAAEKPTMVERVPL